jgi:signal transduction histidine kinase
VVRGDREKVIQIIINLLANGIKFTLPGGRVGIACDLTEDTVKILVSDTGIGIPSDKLDLIFDPFIQVNDTATRTKGGIGLGLAISRGLARGMHGDLTVESKLGEGSRFTLTLPRATNALHIDGDGA